MSIFGTQLFATKKFLEQVNSQLGQCKSGTFHLGKRFLDLFSLETQQKRIKITSDLSIRNKLSLHAIVPYLSSICDFANLCFSGCQFCVIVVSDGISIIASEARHSLTTAVFSFKRVPFRKCILFFTAKLK